MVAIDNLRVYERETELKSQLKIDFEDEEAGFVSSLNKMIVGGKMGRNNNSKVYKDTPQQVMPGYYYLWATSHSRSGQSGNLVLQMLRGDGGNDETYDASTRFYAKKPQKTLDIEFRIKSSGNFTNTLSG